MTAYDKETIKNSIALPQTDFAMRASLPEKEPAFLKMWDDMALYALILKSRKGAKHYNLHDGPPYANGHIHTGHAGNKILKDIIIKSRNMMGYEAPFIPGWDCHGLPIEWKVEEEYRQAGQDKDDVDTLTFRQKCREYAKKWVDIQKEEFKSLGVQGDWENPYLTMAFAAEAKITSEIHRFLMNGGLYKGVRPIMWSVVEKTALAEAEMEYHEHKSVAIWVRFPVVHASLPILKDAQAVIWTTTPWTIPSNRAIAYGEDIDYAVYEIIEKEEDSPAVIGEKLILSAALAETVKEKAKIINWTLLGSFKGKELEGSICAHPFRGQGYEFDIPLLPADFVTTEQGTGLVHIAPGHGPDDFALGKKYNIEITNNVGPDGSFYPHVPLFAGKVIYDQKGQTGDAMGAVLGALKSSGALLAKGSLTHQYPHSWRSKAPLIFLTTPQWFISMETNDLRKKALQAINDVTWYPEKGRNRIRSMIEQRPDWCISRQRFWGVPIAIFVNKETGEPLKDETVNTRIKDIFTKEGADAWYARDPQDFLGDAYKAQDFEQDMNVVDVWFEAGCTHSFVIEDREELQWPADLYLEGSDQHRGWFHSSLLESCGTRGTAPYKEVLTHGFILDEKGYKMSKSLNNTINPQDICNQYGADILRLWTVNTDFSQDTRIGDDILKRIADIYRRLRNTLRYLLGNLHDFEPSQALDLNKPEELPELEQWILHRLKELDNTVHQCFEKYEFNRLYGILQNFCTLDLSAFYFDVLKDSLYCDRPDSFKRQASRTVMAKVFSCLTAWLAPVLVFTTEEAWQQRSSGIIDDQEAQSVHLRRFPNCNEAWLNEDLNQKWQRIIKARSVVLGALEIERAEKKIGSSLQAAPIIYVENDQDKKWLESVDFAGICITSAITIKASPAPEHAFTLSQVDSFAVLCKPAKGHKCERCWQVLEEVKTEGDLCARCLQALQFISKDNQKQQAL